MSEKVGKITEKQLEYLKHLIAKRKKQFASIEKYKEIQMKRIETLEQLEKRLPLLTRSQASKIIDVLQTPMKYMKVSPFRDSPVRFIDFTEYLQKILDIEEKEKR